VNHDEVESQLSAMYDGELPAAECELLSRRIDRDETLRARWSRYALIGAAMRSEPVATARSGFASRVSAALSKPESAQRGKRGRTLLWSGALAATLVASVAGLSISMLRDAALGKGAGAAAPLQALQPAREAGELANRVSSPPAAPVAQIEAVAEQPSYVTPSARGAANTLLRTQLADYIVAHSAYSTPLMRRNLLSELVTGEEGLNGAPGFPAVAVPGQGALVGGVDATRAASDPHH
jgi:negative regulator of sigma E activity